MTFGLSTGINSEAQQYDNSKIITSSFVLLGVEVGAPDPPNAEAVKAKSRAMWLLSQRTYTRQRLRQKLVAYKKFPDDAVSWAMDRVEVSSALRVVHAIMCNLLLLCQSMLRH